MSVRRRSIPTILLGAICASATLSSLVAFGDALPVPMQGYAIMQSQEASDLFKALDLPASPFKKPGWPGPQPLMHMKKIETPTFNLYCRVNIDAATQAPVVPGSGTCFMSRRWNTSDPRRIPQKDYPPLEIDKGDAVALFDALKGEGPQPTPPRPVPGPKGEPLFVRSFVSQSGKGSIRCQISARPPSEETLAFAHCLILSPPSRPLK